MVVLGVSRGGFGRLVDRLAPQHPDLLGLLGMAVLAAVLANLLNNLPATLMLLPLTAHSPGLVLAVLLGANVGPNLTYAGSLATLLGGRSCTGRMSRRRSGSSPGWALLTVPACLVVGVAGLWLSLRIAASGPSVVCGRPPTVPDLRSWIVQISRSVTGRSQIHPGRDHP